MMHDHIGCTWFSSSSSSSSSSRYADSEDATIDNLQISITTFTNK